MPTISVVVSVFNGEKYLTQCLTSVKDIASEIIVVDHESTDNTLIIAKKFTKKVYIQKNNPNDIDRQKNFGFEKASGDWILSLDADEQVSKELAKEITSTINDTSLVANGYHIPRKNIIFGKWIEHTGWYPDYQLRLFKKGKGEFTKKHVHEALAIEGVTGKLLHPLIHENYQTVNQFIRRNLLIYAPNEAQELQENGYVFSFADSIRFPLKEFLGRFFAREGYKDGFHGLILSFLMGVYHFVVFLNLWEKEKFKETSESLPLLASELHASGKQMTYWLKETEIKNTKNPAAKVLLKAKRKLHL